MKILILFCGVLFALTSCQSENPKNAEILPQKEEEKIPNEAKEDALQHYIEEVDNHQEKYIYAKSLYYVNEEGSSIEVETFLNDQSQPVKIIENYLNGPKNASSTRIFYLKNGLKLASRHLFEDRARPIPMFVEKVSFYNIEGKAFLTKQREAEFEEYLINQDFSKVLPESLSEDRALRVLNQTGEFETRFQGFVENQNMLFLIVGGPNKEDFTSSLVVQFQDANIRKLKQDELLLVNKPLRVEFEKFIDDTGFEFQGLITLRILNDENK